MTVAANIRRSSWRVATATGARKPHGSRNRAGIKLKEILREILKKV